MARTVEFEFFPFEDTDPPKGKKREAIDQIGDYIQESILSYVGEENSPVQGHGKFSRLNRDYKAIKVAEGGSPIANLELTGEMLSSMKIIKGPDSITVRISGKQGDKADGHNNHSGESTLPLRRFIPAEGETFKRPILEGVKRIIESLEE